MFSVKKLIVLFAVLFTLISSSWADDIHKAAQKGDLAKVKELLEKNPELVNAKDQDGDTPLMYAATGGSISMVQLLIAEGADIEAKNSAGQTSLLYAVYYGKKEVAEFLLVKGAQINYQDRNGRTPLHYAARNGHRDAVEVLIKYGADLDSCDRFGQTPFTLAFYYNRNDVLDLMMDKDIWEKIKEDNRNLFLHTVASMGNKKLIELLIEKRTNMASTSNTGRTLLHSAASGRLNELAEQMTAKGIDVNAKDNEGRTALPYAVREGSKGLVELLIAKGADINLKGSDGRTPLHIAADWNHTDIMEFLRAKGAKEITREVQFLQSTHLEKKTQGTPALEICYIANDGFLITSPTKKVLIDALQKNPVVASASTADDVFKKMINSQPPFEHINLLLITHAHSDHFDPPMVTQFLLNHPETVLLSSQRVMEELNKASAKNYDNIKHQLKNVNLEFGSITEMTVNDIDIKIVGLNHNTPENKYLNLGFIITMGGIKLFHSGDTNWRSSEKYFEDFHLDKEEIDVALLDQYSLWNPLGQMMFFSAIEIIKDHIQPQIIIPMHIQPMEIEIASNEIKKLHPDVIIFKEPLEKKIFIGMEPQFKSENGATLLHTAAEDDLVDIVICKLNQGMDINVRDYTGATPLMYAARGAQKETIEYLLANGADIHATDYHLFTPLHYLFLNVDIQQKHLEAMKLLIAKGVYINAKSFWGPVLIDAVFRENKEALELLLSSGADVNTGTVDKATPLYFAASSGNKEIVSLLIDHGAKTDFYASSGLTPLHNAAASGQKDMVELLLSKTSKKFYTDQFNRTPLHFAATSGNRDLCDFLIHRRFDAQAKDDNGRTPLHWAAWRGQKDAAAFLIENGAQLDAEDRRGKTALHYAVVSGNVELLRLLIDKGASFNPKDRNGQTPLDLAIIYNRTQAEKILVEKNAIGQPKSLNTASSWIKRDLKLKEAIIWHLGWSGWAIKTKNHLLIFDYSTQKSVESPGLGNGHINPEEIRDLDVIVFASHEHGDHFSPAILEWAKTVKNIKFFFGWKAFDNPAYNYLSETREQRKMGNVEITTVHDFSDVSEAAFLVKVDGVIIFHPGDYVGRYTGRKSTYKTEYDFLSKRYAQVDIAFFGGGLFESTNYMFQKLSPRAAFIQHTSDYNYKGWTKELQKRFPNVKFFYAENRGDRFFFHNGKVSE